MTRSVPDPDRPTTGPAGPAGDDDPPLDSSSRTPRARPAFLVALAVLVLVAVVGFVVLQLAGGHSDDAPGGRDDNTMSQESGPGDPTGPVREDR